MYLVVLCFTSCRLLSMSPASRLVSSANQLPLFPRLCLVTFERKVFLYLSSSSCLQSGFLLHSFFSLINIKVLCTCLPAPYVSLLRSGPPASRKHDNLLHPLRLQQHLLSSVGCCHLSVMSFAEHLLKFTSINSVENHICVT